jgi:hypothetical protein
MLACEPVGQWDLMAMRGRMLIAGVAVFAVVLTLLIAYSAEALSVLSNINPSGALAATFAAVVGFVWFLKTTKRA